MDKIFFDRDYSPIKEAIYSQFIYFLLLVINSNLHSIVLLVCRLDIQFDNERDNEKNINNQRPSTIKGKSQSLEK